MMLFVIAKYGRYKYYHHGVQVTSLNPGMCQRHLALIIAKQTIDTNQ